MCATEFLKMCEWKNCLIHFHTSLQTCSSNILSMRQTSTHTHALKIANFLHSYTCNDSESTKQPICVFCPFFGGTEALACMLLGAGVLDAIFFVYVCEYSYTHIRAYVYVCLFAYCDACMFCRWIFIKFMFTYRRVLWENMFSCLLKNIHQIRKSYSGTCEKKNTGSTDVVRTFLN